MGRRLSGLWRLRERVTGRISKSVCAWRGVAGNVQGAASDSPPPSGGRTQ
jgi:hypothetical protein